MGWVEADTERLNALAYRIALRAADGTRQAEDDLAEFRDLNEPARSLLGREDGLGTTKGRPTR